MEYAIGLLQLELDRLEHAIQLDYYSKTLHVKEMYQKRIDGLKSAIEKLRG